MVASVTRGGQTVTFEYGREHQRVRQLNSGDTTYYVSLGELSHVERQSSFATGKVR